MLSENLVYVYIYKIKDIGVVVPKIIETRCNMQAEAGNDDTRIMVEYDTMQQK